MNKHRVYLHGASGALLAALLLGQFEVIALYGGTATLPSDNLLPHPTPAELDPVMKPAGIDVSKAEISINAFLIHTGSRLVLVDAGIGPGTISPQAGKPVARLPAAGYCPHDITGVVITHIHGDHSAGQAVKGQGGLP